jgi:hypothetical protein
MLNYSGEIYEGRLRLAMRPSQAAARRLEALRDALRRGRVGTRFFDGEQFTRGAFRK